LEDGILWEIKRVFLEKKKIRTDRKKGNKCTAVIDERLREELRVLVPPKGLWG